MSIPCWAAEATKPNIVFILADDLGYGDVHCLNPERGKIATPNMDKLAARGMIFTDAPTATKELCLGRRGPAAPTFEAADVLPTLTKKATDWILEHGTRPFFLYLALNAPHTPPESDAAMARHKRPRFVC